MSEQVRIWQDGRKWVCETAHTGKELGRFDSQAEAEKWAEEKGHEVVW